CFWRVTMLPARMAVFDARMVFFVALFLLHIRLWTFGVLVFACLVFFILEQRGLSLPAAGRLVRSLLAGSRRPAVFPGQRRSRISYAFEGAGGGRFDLLRFRETPTRIRPAVWKPPA